MEHKVDPVGPPQSCYPQGPGSRGHGCTGPPDMVPWRHCDSFWFQGSKMCTCHKWRPSKPAHLKIIFTVVVAAAFLREDSFTEAGTAASHDPGGARACGLNASPGKQGVMQPQKGRLPYLVSIRRHGTREHVCTGILVDAWSVLTAAHCVDPQSAYSAGPRPVVYIGPISVDDADDDVQVQTVSSTDIHEMWNPVLGQRSPFNAALLHLSRRSDKQTPQILTDHVALRAGLTLSVVGWGIGAEGPGLGQSIFTSLKVEHHQFLDAAHCNRSTLWNGNIQSGVVCGLTQEGRASCIADSGSPIMLLDMPKNDLDSGRPFLDFVVGINIDGAPCGTSARPDIFLDLRELASWIQTRINVGGHDREL